MGNSANELTARLLKAWRGEIEAGYVYRILARRESDTGRSEILSRIAAAEDKHRRRIEQRMGELGIEVPKPSSVRISYWLRLQARLAPIEILLQAREAAEDDEVLDLYGKPTGDAATDEVLASIRQEERSHALAINEMTGRGPTTLEGIQVNSRLQRLLGRERWHKAGTGWVSDAIYGANDGLAAVFGIVAGVSGATGGSGFVLTAGLFGALASALSMGVGAWLATRSKTEIAHASLDQERREIEEHPEEEIEELSLFYQLKGLSPEAADQLARKLAENPEAMLETLAFEEFGGLEDGGNPWTAAIAGFVSTAVGAIVPVLPFFWLRGADAVVLAAVISLVAHFLVGAAKSLVTLRSWWGAGLEMTLAGVLVGVPTYILGLLFKISA